MFSQGFSGPVYAGETIECQVDGFDIVATIHADEHADAPWDAEDGHGPVSDWRRHAGGGVAGAAKRPGELMLLEDRGAARFYDFAEACRIARRDGWGTSPYRLDTETTINGLRRVTGQWFEGRELQTFRSDWHDDENEAIRQVYAAHRATMSPRQYASLAARSDFERLRKWCNDEWQYVGVDVTVRRNGVQLVDSYQHALWGINSDSPDYLTEVANELADEALESARETLESLCA